MQALLAYCTAYEVFVWIYYATTRPHVWVYDNLNWGKNGLTGSLHPSPFPSPCLLVLLVRAALCC